MRRYPSIPVCRELLFPFIRRHMALSEPAPFYEGELLGLEHLQGIFALMRRREYRGVIGKCAYLFCSVIDGHHFSNGNKRLAVALLTYSLLMNGKRISAPAMDVMREELKRIFPKIQWEEVRAFRYPHEYFLYHLALVIADRRQKGAISFTQEQVAVRALLTFVTI